MERLRKREAPGEMMVTNKRGQQFSVAHRGIRNRALPGDNWMSPSSAILLMVIHAMFNLSDVTSRIFFNLRHGN